MRWAIFLGLALAGQILLVVLARFLLVPLANRLQRRYGFGTPTFTDIIVTVPMLLQIVWVIAVLYWIME